MRPRFSPVTPDYYPLGGGLDLLTPAISMPPGKVISSQNYEPEIGGGYKRIAGYERFDGRALASSASYWIFTVNLYGSVSVGDTIDGNVGAPRAVVLAILSATTLIVAVTLGTFIPGTTIGIFLGADIGTVNATDENAATNPSDHADYRALAADYWRTQASAITGSGAIRGVWHYGGSWYAFRDNAGGTAGNMWKATGSGWSQITFGKEIQFTGAVGEFFAGDIVYGNTSTATATIVKPMLRTGTWTVAGAGTLILSGITGTFQSGESLKLTNAGGAVKVTSSSLATDITRAPGGKLQFHNANFTGSTATKKMYGADGVNKAFEFDGTNYIPIRTGMTTDTPSKVREHKKHLFLSFLGSVQYSSVGYPYGWTVVTGSGEIATGEVVTDFVAQGGSATSASLAIMTEGRTFVLYGTPGASDFQLVPSGDDIGSFAFCAQSIGNDTMMLTNRGIQRLRAVQEFGNFAYSAVSDLVQPLITAKRGLQLCSTTLKTRNQYRVFMSDNTAITVGLTGDKISGIMPLDYGIPVRCVCTAEATDGAEVTMFGSDDGYVYQDNSGTSFDGEPITAWIRMPFNNLKGPRVRKRFRSAVLELVVDGYAEINVAYDLGYGTPDVAQGLAAADQQLLAAGGFWDQLTWDTFTWDTQAVGNPRISLDGTEKNISIVFYSVRNQDNPYTLQGVTINHSALRLER